MNDARIVPLIPEETLKVKCPRLNRTVRVASCANECTFFIGTLKNRGVKCMIAQNDECAKCNKPFVRKGNIPRMSFSMFIDEDVGHVHLCKDCFEEATAIHRKHASRRNAEMKQWLKRTDAQSA